MSTVIIVGSGPSGVHLAETLLARGAAVTMLDVGHGPTAQPLPDADFESLKDRLDDPVAYFLGARGDGIVFPSPRKRYFAFPPSKGYVFRHPRDFAAVAEGFEPVISFASGGLAEAWTGGSYPLNDAELQDFPLRFDDLRPHYEEVVRRIGVAAARDDLEHFSPWLDGYLEPVDPDPNSAALLSRYALRREMLNRSLGFYLGRSRVSMVTRPWGERGACDKLGRCLWGCPRSSLYSPSSTLRELRRNPAFRYVPDTFVTHFEYEGDTVSGIVGIGPDGREQRHTADCYALAAGTLCSSKILLDSIYRRTGDVPSLQGLMDNRQVLVPFLNLRMIGRRVSSRAYQYHQVAIGLEQDRPEEFVHGQITTLKAASVHPVAASLPVDLRSAIGIFRVAHAALGAANIWFADRRSDDNTVTLRPREGGAGTDLVLSYSPKSDDRLLPAITKIKRALRALGCVVPPGMTAVLPSGSSVHYAGTIPMQSSKQPMTCSADCRSHDFGNLYFADGATFPFLPAKNLTFTLMANAIRVGHGIARDLQLG